MTHLVASAVVGTALIEDLIRNKNATLVFRCHPLGLSPLVTNIHSMSSSQNSYETYDELYSGGSQSGYAQGWFDDWQSQPYVGTSQQLGPTASTSYRPQLPFHSPQPNPSLNSNHYESARPAQTQFDPPPSALLNEASFFNFSFNQAVSPTYGSLQSVDHSLRQSLSPLNFETQNFAVATVPRPSQPLDPRVAFDRLPKEVHDRICAFLEPREIVQWSQVSDERPSYLNSLMNGTGSEEHMDLYNAAPQYMVQSDEEDVLLQCRASTLLSFPE